MTPLKQTEPYRTKMKKIILLEKFPLTLFFICYFGSKEWNFYFVWQDDRLELTTPLASFWPLSSIGLSMVFQSLVKTFVCFFFQMKWWMIKVVVILLVYHHQLNEKKTFLKKKKTNVILISTIILLNLTFSLINDKKGASTIVTKYIWSSETIHQLQPLP